MNHDWAGPVAFVLAIGIAVGYAGTILLMLVPWGPERVPPVTVDFLSTLGGAMIGAVATYMGIRRRRDGSD